MVPQRNSPVLHENVPTGGTPKAACLAETHSLRCMLDHQSANGVLAAARWPWGKGVVDVCDGSMCLKVSKQRSRLNMAKIHGKDKPTKRLIVC